MVALVLIFVVAFVVTMKVHCLWGCTAYEGAVPMGVPMKSHLNLDNHTLAQNLVNDHREMQVMWAEQKIRIHMVAGKRFRSI